MTDDELASIRARISTLAELNRSDEVVALAQRGLTLAPDDGWLLAQLALALVGTDPRGARTHARQAVAAAPEDPWTHRVAAGILVETDRPKQARTHAERAAALAPWDPSSHLVLAHVYDACGLPTKAANAVDEVVRLAPSSPAGYVERSRLSLRSRDWPGAVRWATKALEIDPGNAAALNNLAVARGQQGQRAEALDLFARAAAAEPDDPVAAENARHAASGLGGFAFGGIAIFLTLRLFRAAYEVSLTAALVLVALVIGGLGIAGHLRFVDEVKRLPPHLQAFAREQRRIRWRRPTTWLGSTRRTRILRIGVLIALPILFVLAANDHEDPPQRRDAVLPPGLVACLEEERTGAECDALLRP